ncbi:MAG: hypothetical protein QM433_11440 [Euryarchaeota archaeon]|nr:hypothetical protein [Methanothrix sp.]MDI9400133.1 hypothetical protein [Euryarchaeota archaeon]
MRFSTSRRPSPRSRRFARTLASFFGSEYTTRGKAGLDNEEEVWMVVVEEHGNPAGLARRSHGEEKVLHFSVSVVEVSKRPKKMNRPRVVVMGKAAHEVAEFFGLDISPESPAGRAIRVGDHQIDFVDGEDLVLRLKI